MQPVFPLRRHIGLLSGYEDYISWPDAVQVSSLGPNKESLNQWFVPLVNKISPSMRPPCEPGHSSATGITVPYSFFLAMAMQECHPGGQ